jgi:phosphoribosylformylglycinamidine cyclo-ligase
MNKTYTYAGSGVDYGALDPFKRMAQAAARDTARNIVRLGFAEVGMSRGESVYLIETPDSYLAHVEEGLGTKNLVADAMQGLTGKPYYGRVAQDTVAMIVNDMITLGATPVSLAMHLAVGSSDWFNDTERSRDLVEGWKNACGMARAVWGGGETPTLKDVVAPGAAVLSGSAVGVIKPKERLIAANIQHGDAIVLLESSGIHANGLTLARALAEALPEGYLAKLDDGRAYGDALLDPTHIYTGLVEDCLNQGVRIHYAVNITGHGWRKLMRADAPFTYVIETLPRALPIFDFIQKRGSLDDAEAYGNLNMGAGFALYVPAADVDKVLHVVAASAAPYRAFRAGYIERGEKKVVISPRALEFNASTLAVR